ncbi:hypothetical protein [Mucilaginibacter ginkgonis]|uniref:Uncharacterized protein n=1 Tax=Mucilaginibacter ginkgonis TaxID=2682091 RepID=A0A6I4HTT7_9SPHI|nr:hypothetical protein [Mucilaginibacter ginkgonis]QQL50391.1 hypothetical protein GO620_002735 [Mucilaginibacter ginkgonis]
MRKAAILTLTAFYLLLSTGMYVCAMHCAAADVVSASAIKPVQEGNKMGMADMECCHKTSKKPASKENKDCGKHASFSVTENLKPVSESISFVPGEVSLFDSKIFDLQKVTALIPDVQSTRGPAPPLISGRDYLIKIRTLLI